MSILFLREVLRLRFTKNIKKYLKYCVVMFGIKKKHSIGIGIWKKTKKIKLFVQHFHL